MLDHRRANDARAYRIHENPGFGVVQRRRARQLYDTTLGCTVGRRSLQANQPCCRCRVDDGTATLLEHLGDLVLHAEPDTLEVDSDRVIPVCLGAVSRWSVRPRNTGVVMRVIQSAVGLDDLLNQRFNLGRLRDIGPHKKSISTGLFDYPYGLLTALDKDVGNDSFRPFSGKRQCACPPYSRSGARHQSHFAFELLGHSPLPGKVKLTFEFTPSRKRAKPAVASRVQRRVRPHGCSEALGRVACPKLMAMKKVDAERTSSFASGCDLAGQLSGSYPNSRSSCEQRQALAIFAAHWTAASRDGSSRTQKPPSNSLVCG